MDVRPANCRFRLQDEGKPYGRSSCSACGKGIFSGLGNQCSVAPDLMAARMGDLLPCPFCGASAQISTRTDECIWSHDQVEWTAVSCSGGPDFDCFQPSVDWPTSATDDHGTQLSISQWNRRAIPAADARAEAHSAAMMKAWEAVYAAKTLSEAVDAIHQLAGATP